MIFIKESKLIVDNQKEFVDCLRKSTFKLQKLFNNNQYTDSYPKYNIFNISATNVLMYKLFNEIKGLVKDELGHDKPLWMQSWVNYQAEDNLLAWHNHDWEYHGYICIDPKNTKTIFEDFEIENKIGQIYFGEGHKPHKVEAVEPFSGYRITIGYDITSKADQQYTNLGLMPF